MELNTQELRILRAWGDEYFDKKNGFNKEELDLWDRLHNELVTQSVRGEEHGSH